MLTRERFALALKEKIKEGFTPAQIGSWVHSTYLALNEDLEEGLWSTCVQLGTMEVGPEFEFTTEELKLIAEKILLDEVDPVSQIREEKLRRFHKKG